MKVYLTHFTKIITHSILILLSTFVLQSCGGTNDKTANYSISVSQPSISFSNEFITSSTDYVDITVNFQGQGNGLLIGFSPDANAVAWLNYEINDLTETSATVRVNLQNADQLLPDNYNTTLRFSTGDPTNSALVYDDIDVSLLVWQLTTNNNLVSFGAVNGSSSIASETLEITSENNQWQASVDASWLTLDTTEGPGSGTITITPDITSFTEAGLYQANITLTELSSGDTKIIPVELGLDNIYLFADQANIALTDTASTQALTKTVTILTNSVSSVNWQAVSNVDWLVLTPLSQSNQLTLTVDKTKAPKDQQSIATVTVSATNDASVIPETIHVGLYQSTQADVGLSLSGISPNNNEMVAAPLQPLIYLAVANELRVYNQYSGALIHSSVISPDSSTLEQLVIHPNGQLLFAQADVTSTDTDGVSTTVTHRYKIDLSSYESTEIDNATIEYNPETFVRLNGRYFVVTQTLEYADTDLQRLAWDTSDLYFTQNIDVASVAQSLYALDRNTESLKRYVANVNDFTTSKLSTQLTHTYHPELMADSEQMVSYFVTPDEQAIYLNSASTNWLSFDGSTFTDNGVLAVDSGVVNLQLLKLNSGNPLFVRFSPTDAFYADSYDNLQQIATVSPIGLSQPTQSIVTSDDSLLINYVASDQTISSVPLIK